MVHPSGKLFGTLINLSMHLPMTSQFHLKRNKNVSIQEDENIYRSFIHNSYTYTQK
jgi:hypothetical protein